jgi:mono/diheme cytochrome c family protein
VFCVVTPAPAADREVERGQYLVTVISGGDCHTPGGLLENPTASAFSEVPRSGFALPDLGVFYGSNLTPDKETGLGNWTAEQIAVAIRTGERPDGRKLAPVMPVASFSHLTAADALAIAAYLNSLPPIRNKVAGPFGPNQQPTGFVMSVRPAEALLAKRAADQMSGRRVDLGSAERLFQ